jgi:hypothetical protein
MKLKVCFLFFALLSLSSINAQVPTNGLVASYQLDGDLTDGVGTSHLQTPFTVFYQPDRFGNSGSALNVNRTKFEGYTFTGINNTLSISFWASFNTTSSSAERILQIYDANGGGFRVVYNRPGGALEYNVNATNSGSSISTTPLPTTSNNVWHHIVITIDKTSTLEARGYLNGSLDPNLTVTNASAPGDIFNSNARFTISPISGNQPAAYSGAIDEMYLYDRVLNASEVSDLFNIGQVQEIKYVDANATGNNDGSSWTDAYTSFNSALNSVSSGDEIWVAKGVYKPSLPGGLINQSFELDVNAKDVKIYGGFAGTETDLSDRDMSLIHTTNKTVFSGDINDDDNTNILFDNPTKVDNSYRIFTIRSNNITIDGVTISDANARALSGTNRFGAAVSIENNVNAFTLENCIIENNVAFWAAGLNLASNVSANFNINNCVFRNNLSNSAGTYYVVPGSNTTTNVSVTNNLFENNITRDDLTPGFNRDGLGSPAGWIRVFNSNVILNVTLVNNTFVNNQSEGSGSSDLPTVGFSTAASSSGNYVLANNLFWGNTTSNGNTALAFGRVVDNFVAPNTNEILNTIDEDGFSNLPGLIGMNDNSNVNPNLTSDFKLQASSTSAIDNGLNSALPSGITLDLAGNTRIVGSAVDIGAFEYDAALSTTNFNDVFVSSIYPNPVDDVLYINAKNDIQTIEVYSLLGKIVAKKKNTTSIEVNGLRSGVYLLKVTDVSGSQSTLRFLKK